MRDESKSGSSITQPLELFLFLLVAGYFALLYFVPPIRYYNIFYLQNFDFGILFHSTFLLSDLADPFMRVRGAYIWADNQDYFQYIFALLHFLPKPHYLILLLHSSAIYSVGVFCFLWLKDFPWLRIAVATFAWLSPQMLNMNLDLAHTEAFATIFILLVFAAASRNRTYLFYLFLLLAISCKEDVAITVGAFCTLAWLKPGFFSLQRKHFAIGLGICLLVFGINLLLILPQYKLASCRWLDPDFSGAVDRAPNAIFFRDIFSRLSDPANYLDVFQRESVAIYAGKLFWPAILVAGLSFPFTLLAIPGAFINIISSSEYLVETFYHYDHSTFAAVLIAFLIGFRRAKRKKLVAILLLCGSLGLHSIEQKFNRVYLWEPFKPHFWQYEKVLEVRILERLNQTLPSDIVVSADYLSISYVMGKRREIYMFQNPFESAWFGVYGVCTQFAQPPLADVLIAQKDIPINERISDILKNDYQQFDLGADRRIRVFVRTAGSQFENLKFSLELIQRDFPVMENKSEARGGSKRDSVIG